MNKLMKMFSFTKNETKVILFIVTVLIAGFSIKYYKQIISTGSLTPYDYNKSDSEFIEKSQNINKRKPQNQNDNSKLSEEQLASLLTASEDSLIAELKNSKDKADEYSGPKLNINTATQNDFIDLPGIGESIAGKIITYRDSKKKFKRIEELMNVNGIGKKKFEKIKNYIKAE
jgi:comEA protein